MDFPYVRRKTDRVLLRDLCDLIASECSNTALIVAHIAEVDRRKLYVKEGYPSMYLYCVEGLHLSEASAYKRIHAARAARKCSEILTALADGRVHLSAICMLAPYLTRRNGPELLAAVTHRRRFEIQEMLASRFPQPDRLALDPEVRALPPALPPAPLPPIPALSAFQFAPGAPATERTPNEAASGEGKFQLAPGAVISLLDDAPSQTQPIAPQAFAGPAVPVVRQATPLAPDRYELLLVIDKETHDLLERAQDLLSHSVPSRSVVEIFRRSLLAVIAQTEKSRAAVGSRPRGTVARRAIDLPAATRQANDEIAGDSMLRSLRIASRRQRYIPAQERRTVWVRDQGRCTGTDDNGKRCEARDFLEFDHIIPVALGGKSIAANLRLRCRAHNQYEAERVFGVEFMRKKREQARRAAQERSTAEGKPEPDSTRSGASSTEKQAESQAKARGGDQEVGTD